MEMNTESNDDMVLKYDDQFPPLPCSNESSITKPKSIDSSSKLRYESKNSTVTQSITVPLNERRFNGDFNQSSQKKVCESIAQRCGVSIELNCGGKDHNLTVFITGIPSKVQDAKKILSKELQTQIQVDHIVPKEYHRFILGRNGANLRDIENKSSTNITMPRANENSDRIVIHGTKEGTESAKAKIDEIVFKRSKMSTEYITIPKRFYPFIQGHNNSKLNQVRDSTNTKINMPPPSVQTDEIVITGETEGVNQALQYIKSVYEAMQRSCSQLNISIEKSQHKYIYGKGGSGIADILEKTGVSVEIPGLEDDNSNIVLFGPADKLAEAVTMVIQKSEAMYVVMVDAPVWLHRYIIGKSGSKLKEIQQNKQIYINIKDDSDKISIEGPKDLVLEARDALVTRVAELQQSMDLVVLQVDPRFHRHIIGRSGANINRLQDENKVQITMPGNNAVGAATWEIRIEGDPEGVKRTKIEVESMKTKLENEKTKDVIIKHKYHSHLIGAQGSKIKDLRSQYPDVIINFPDTATKSDIVQVRGPRQAVDQAAKKLEKLVQEVIENNYMKEVKIFKQYHKNIIGKGGSNIKKIREETNIRIDFPDEQSDHDMIVLTGKREKVEEAARKIEAIQAELISIKEDSITIPRKLHNTLIGTRGKLIRSIQEECGGVQIQFPTVDSKSDVITIRGPEADVDKAKKRLQELAEKNQLLAHQETIQIKVEFHKFLIGRKGLALEEFRKRHPVILVFPDSEDTDKDIIQIIGAKEAVIKAKAELAETAKTLENEVEKKITIDPKWHKHFFKRRQYLMEDISRDFGGVKIYFPKIDAIENADEVRVVGPKGCIEAAIRRIESIIENLEAQTSINVCIEQKHHRNLLTRNMSEIKEIQNTYDVTIKFPSKDLVNRQESYNDANSQNGEVNGENGHTEEIDDTNPANLVSISGRIENCQSAKDALLDLVPITEEVELDNEFHRNLIGQKGQGINNFSSKYNVIVNIPQANKNSNYISIKGPRRNIDEAKLGLQELKVDWEKEKEDRILKNFELEVEVPTVFHRNLIGQRGSNIDTFRNKFNVNIQMPDQNSGSSIVIVRGYEEDANKAKEEICSMVAKLQAQRRESVYIPKDIHPVLIGTRGFNLRKLKEQYKVDIQFPSKNSDEEKANYVEVIGDPANVDECCDYLVERANELLDEFEIKTNVPTTTTNITANLLPIASMNHRGNNAPSSGFVLTGAPWQQNQQGNEQRVPDSRSNEDFPRMVDARGDILTNNTTTASSGDGNSCLLNGH